jgi:hypothetical protein
VNEVSNVHYHADYAPEQVHVEGWTKLTECLEYKYETLNVLILFKDETLYVWPWSWTSGAVPSKDRMST